nr:ATP-binding protein [Enterovirga sp.]
GRKRGLAGVIATQRLAKLAKNVAAEASNFLMGRTFLDIDMARAADLLGMDRRGAEMFRDLERGHFVALGPALSRRPLPVRIGEVATESRGGSPALLPLPEPADDARGLLFAAPSPTEAPPRPLPRPKPAPDVLVQLASYRPPAPAEPEEPALAGAEREAAIEAVLAEVLADRDAGASHVATLYQDFTVRCRIRRIGGEALDLPAFRRRLAVARAGIAKAAEGPAWEQAQALAADLPDDLHGLFLLLAQAALKGLPTPSDEDLARAYGTSSAGRARRMIGYLEERGAVVCRRDLRGAPVVAIPALGCETAPGEPEAGTKLRARR